MAENKRGPNTVPEELRGKIFSFNTVDTDTLISILKEVYHPIYHIKING